MPDPVTFQSASPRFGLPLLFAGQAQKEFYVNQAHALADALLHPVAEGTLDEPPADAAEGACWIVGPAATADWSGKAGMLACRQSGTWLFVSPREGMRLFDRSAGQDLYYRGGWQKAASPDAPEGGATVDAEARAAIAGLISALATAGILAA